VQQGRFSCTGWAGYDDEFACVQSEVEVHEDVHLLVAPLVLLADAIELQYGRLNLNISRRMAASSTNSSRRGG
jgi:hypothetical protein